MWVGDSKSFENFSDKLMNEISRDLFFEGMALPASIYIRVRPGRYLLVGKKNSKAAFSHFHAFKKEHLPVFVQNHEYPDLIRHVTAITEQIIQQKNLPPATKMKFLNGLVDDALRSFEAGQFRMASKVQRVSHLIRELSQQLSNFTEVIAVLETLPEQKSKHSLTTAMISLLLCDELKMTMPSAQEKCIMGALLHDVGLKMVPQSILEKPRSAWTASEKQTYEQHPLMGVELLRNSMDIPSDVLLIISEHHEESQGTGYPRKLRDVKMSPLSKVVALADSFTELLFETGIQSLTAEDVVRYQEEVLGQPFNRQAFQALKKLILKIEAA